MKKVCLLVLLFVGVLLGVQAQNYAFVKEINGLEDPWDIAVDARGHIYVVDKKHVCKFDSTGKLLAKWDTCFSGTPKGIAINSAGHIYVGDRGKAILKLNSDGKVLKKWDNKLLTWSLAVNANDWLHVGLLEGTFATAGNNVLLFDTSGNEVVAARFKADGLLGVASNRDSGQVYVATYKLKVYDSIYFIKTIGGDSARTLGVAYHSGSIFTSNRLLNSNNIQKYSTSGQLLAKWGTTGSGPGQFNNPQGVAVDNKGKVYVVDKDNKRVQIFAPALVTSMGIEEKSATSAAVYPNPNSGDFMLQTSGRKSKVSVATSNGHRLLQYDIPQGTSVTTMSGLEKGLYLVKVEEGEKVEMIKVMVE